MNIFYARGARGAAPYCAKCTVGMLRPLHAPLAWCGTFDLDSAARSLLAR